MGIFCYNYYSNGRFIFISNPILIEHYLHMEKVNQGAPRLMQGLTLDYFNTT